MKADKHGGDIYSFAKKQNIALEEVIDLSSNINPNLPMLSFDFNTIDPRAYPDPNYQNLKKRLAKHFSVKSENIGLFNGASAAIFSLIRHLKGDVVLYAPLYGEYQRACTLFDKNVMMLNRFEDIEMVVPKESIVVFVNPSTPDGLYHDLKKLVTMWIEQECSIIIDESFLAFTEFGSVWEYAKDYPKLYVIKSLTKFYACAGVRLGVVLSNKEAIRELMAKEPAWMISRGDEVYISEALKDKNFAKQTRSYFFRERQRLFKVLQKAPQIAKVYESDVNFFLVHLKEDWDEKRFARQCAKENILVRGCSNFSFLSNRHVRIAVKTKEATKALKKALFA